MQAFLHGVTAPVRALIVSFAITAIGQGLWGGLVFANIRFRPDLPWAAPTMAVVLFALLSWLGGAGWPRGTSETRRRLLNFRPIPSGVFFQALLAGVLALGALGGIWLATSDLITIPQGTNPDTSGYPPLTVLSFLVMGCVAAPLSEEAAFRGYAQGILARAWKWGPAVVVGSSLLFAAAHFPQGLVPAKLALYFLAGLIFGTIAWLTRSLIAGVVVHSLADVMGFLLLWPHDSRAHGMILEGGYDPVFWPAVAATAIFVPLSIWAFVGLHRMTRRQPEERPLMVLAPA